MQTSDMHMNREMASEAQDESPAVKTPVEARAGLISGHVITILVLGTALAIILLASAVAYFAG